MSWTWKDDLRLAEMHDWLEDGRIPGKKPMRMKMRELEMEIREMEQRRDGQTQRRARF